MTHNAENDALACCPEWCEQQGDPGHDDTCPEAPLTITKGAFVTATQGGAEAAIAAYLICLEEGMSHDEALEMTLAEDEESAVCFAGIGSCGRGWCDHS